MRPNLHHAIDERLVELILLISTVLCRASRNKVLLSLRALLRHQTHWQLSNVDRVVWVMLTRSTRILSDCRGGLILIDEVEIHVVDHSLLLAHLAGARSLDGSETPAANFMVAVGAAVHAAAVRDCIQLLLSDSPLLLARRRLLA